MMLKLLVPLAMVVGVTFALDGRVVNFDAAGNHTELLEKFGPFGGNGGDPFTDSAAKSQRISAFDVFYGSERLRGIRVLYDDGAVQPELHGNTGGTHGFFDVFANETITAVNIRFGDRVRGIQFVTSDGRISPFFGKQASDSASVNLPGGLRFISGRAGDRVNQLNFHN